MESVCQESKNLYQAAQSLFRSGILTLVSRLKLTSYDVFALTVAVMLIGHSAAYFLVEGLWWRVPDRIMVPIFLVSVGYNAGWKSGLLLWSGAVALTLSNALLLSKVNIDMLGAIILIRLILTPVMDVVLQDRKLFWVFCTALALLGPYTTQFVEYGTTGLLMAMAGWINRNREDVPTAIVTPANFFIFSGLSFFGLVVSNASYSFMQMLVMIVGGSVVMGILYDFNTLILASLKRRPRDVIGRTCSFLGHKSLEIYLVHTLILQAILFFIFGGPLG